MGDGLMDVLLLLPNGTLQLANLADYPFVASGAW